MSTIQSQIAELEARIAQLRSSQLNELKEQLRDARKTVSDLEAQIAQITGNAPATPIMTPRRKRMDSEEIKGAILKALASTQEGLSGKEISEATEIGYQTVLAYLKRNSKDFKTTGAARSKKFFLK